jgi:regulator of nonsense transcripts 2
LDSSLKRNTAFVRKVKVISEDQRTSILKEAQELNLTRYLEEVANSIAEVSAVCNV